MSKKDKSFLKKLDLKKLLIINITILGLTIFFFLTFNFLDIKNFLYDKTDSSVNPSPSINECDLVECPYMEVSLLRGYYSTYTAVDWDNNTVQCNSFTVQDSTQKLIDGFWLRKARQNGLNNINERNQLMVSIDIEDLTTELRQKILNSNENNIITLQVQSKEVKPMGVSACFSLINILDVLE